MDFIQEYDLALKKYKKHKSVLLFTDGSCVGNGSLKATGGWAWFEPNKGIACGGRGEIGTTNNIMELTAVIEGIKFWSKEPVNEIIIFSDSQYVINCAKGLWRKKVNLNLWEEYEKITKGLIVSFVWVKGHANNKHNIFVDKLANEARLSKD